MNVGTQEIPAIGRPTPRACFGEDFSHPSIYQYFYTLLTHPGWVDRRVQSFEPIDEDNIQQKTSIDINVKVLKEYAHLSGVQITDTMLVPLGLMRRGLLPNLSVLDEEGHPMPLLESELDANLWKGILSHFLKTDKGCMEIINFYRYYKEFNFRDLEDDILCIVEPIDTLSELEFLPGETLNAEIMNLPTTYALCRAVLLFLMKKQRFNSRSLRYQIWKKLLLEGRRDLDKEYKDYNQLGQALTPQTPDLEKQRKYLEQKREDWERAFQNSKQQKDQNNVIFFIDLLKTSLLYFIPVVEMATTSPRYIIKYQVKDTRGNLRNSNTGYSEDIAQNQETFAYKMWNRENTYPVSLDNNEKTSQDWHTFCRAHSIHIRRRKAHPVIESAMDRLGLRPVKLWLDTSLISHASREHIRIICPPGVCVARLLEFYKTKARSKDTVLQQTAPDNALGGLERAYTRATRDCVMLYTRAGQNVVFDPARSPRARLYLSPRLTGFWSPALFMLLVSIALSALSWAYADRITKSYIDTVVTFLLLVASLSSLYVARPDEHRYRGIMLAWPRFFVALSGILVASIAAALIFVHRVSFVKGVALTSLVGCVLIFTGFLIFGNIHFQNRNAILAHSGESTNLLDDSD